MNHLEVEPVAVHDVDSERRKLAMEVLERLRGVKEALARLIDVLRQRHAGSAA